MRKLTVKRTKTGVACLMKVHLYIEDPSSDEITINDIPCRKLGSLKNGEEQTFEIEDTEAKVFAITDKLSKNICNEYYQLPEGQEDIYLSGKNKYNPFAGNPFRFDNNTTEDVKAHRKRSVRRTILFIFIPAFIVGVIIGLFHSGIFFKNDPDPKDFSSNGMTVTLTDEFREADMEDFTVVYDSENVGVFAIKEKFSLLPGSKDFSLNKYLELVLEANDLTPDNVKRSDGLVRFTYDADFRKTDDTYRYFCYVYKADDAFWLIQFVVLAEDADKYEDQITEWAKSVTFSNGK